MPRIWTEEQKDQLRDNLARGRKTRAANIAARKSAPPPAAEPFDFTQTPEFRAALEAQKQELLRAVAQQIVSQAPATPADSLQKTMEQLALTIGDLTNQNSGQKLVSPEVLAERRAASRRMEERLDQAQEEVRAAEAAGDVAGLDEAMPRYRLNAKVIMPGPNGDEIIEPLRRGGDNRVYPTEVNWLLAPNLAMAPLNTAAKEIFVLFKQSIGNQTNTRIRGVQGKGANAEPIFDTREHDDYMITPKGNIVTGGSPTLQMRNTINPEDMGVAAPLVRQGIASISGQSAGRAHSGPPTIQVRVLGTIAPPAVQNG